MFFTKTYPKAKHIRDRQTDDNRAIDAIYRIAVARQNCTKNF